MTLLKSFLIALLSFVLFVAVLCGLGYVYGGYIATYLFKSVGIPVYVGRISFWGKELVAKPVEIEKSGLRVSIEKLSVALDLSQWCIDSLDLDGLEAEIDSTSFKNPKNKSIPNANLSVLPQVFSWLAVCPVRSLNVPDIKVRFKHPKHILDISGKISFYRPHVEDKFFSFKSDILLQEINKEKGKIFLSGWVDWDRKNADFDLKILAVDLDLMSDLFDITDIKGIADIAIEGTAKNNELVLDNVFEVREFAYPKIDAIKEFPVLSSLLPVVNKLSSQFRVGFTVKSRLDEMQFDFKRALVRAIKHNLSQIPDEKEKDRGGFYDIINDLVSMVGAVMDTASS